MSEYINGQDLPISIAVWLALDEYKANHEILSATQLIKPIRKLILSYRLEKGHVANVVSVPIEIMGMLKSRKGTAVHSAIEAAWTDPVKRAKGLKALGYTDASIELFVVNAPDEYSFKKGEIPVYTERFCEREHSSGYWVGGTADMVVKGRLSDYKNTSTYSFNDPVKAEVYKLQGSIYRWAMPDIVTEDEMDIVEMYDDWTKARAFGSGYPSHPIMVRRIPLMPIRGTEKYIGRKINDLIEFLEVPEAELPFCSDEDLWRKADVYKYFTKETNKKSSGNFSTYEEAAQAHRAGGGIGVIKTVKGKAVACRFCEARPICGQAKALKASGDLDE